MPIKWGEPPDPVYPASDNHPAWVAELQRQPGRWALVFEGLTKSKANYYQSQIALGLWTHTRNLGKWEATRRTLDDGSMGIWVRYVGPA